MPLLASLSVWPVLRPHCAICVLLNLHFPSKLRHAKNSDLEGYNVDFLHEKKKGLKCRRRGVNEAPDQDRVEEHPARVANEQKSLCLDAAYKRIDRGEVWMRAAGSSGCGARFGWWKGAF